MGSETCDPLNRGSSVTLIFYAIDRKNIMKEPWLNLGAAAAQGSVFTHVEVAIGEAAGEGGQMKNVLRVFNDDVVSHATRRGPRRVPFPAACAMTYAWLLLRRVSS